MPELIISSGYETKICQWSSKSHQELMHYDNGAAIGPNGAWFFVLNEDRVSECLNIYLSSIV